MDSNTHGSWWEQGTVLFAVMVVTLALLWYKRLIWSSQKGTPPLPPGPYGLPILGYLPFLGPSLHLELNKLAHRYGPIFKLYLGSNLHIVVNSAELAKVVTSEQDENFANRAPHIAGLATSYGANDIAFSSNNADRRKLRKILVHEALGSVSLEASHAYRRREVRKTVKHVHDMIGTTVDINEISFSTVLSVLTSIVWGKGMVKGAKYSDFVAEMRKFVSGTVEIAEGLNISDFFPMLARFDLQGVERKFKKQMMLFDQIFENAVEERSINSKSIDKEETVKQEGRKDLLQILLEFQDQLNVTQMKALVVDVFLGGTDATSAMVEWTMTEILRDQKAMKKVQDELAEIVGLNNIVEESHLPKLKYLDAVCKEAFRLHPPLPFLLPRSPNKTCTVGGYTVPKGSTIFVNVWAIQRDPRYWKNPSEFDPERFFNYKGPEKWDYNGANSKFFPFGSGRRRCPGLTLAEKMMMYILASLLHSFDWRLPEGQELDLSDKFGIALKKSKPLIAVPSQRLTDVSLYM